MWYVFCLFMQATYPNNGKPLTMLHKQEFFLIAGHLPKQWKTPLNYPKISKIDDRSLHGLRPLSLACDPMDN